MEHVPHWDIGHQIQAEFIIFDLKIRVLIFRKSKAIQLPLQDLAWRVQAAFSAGFLWDFTVTTTAYASQVKNEGGYTAYELSLRGGETGARSQMIPDGV